MNRIGGIIIAAGGSRRLGEPKQLLPFHNTTLLNHTISEVSKTAVSPLVVVTGAFHDRVSASLDEEANVCYNENWQEGIGSSIRNGLQQVLDLDDTLSAVVLLVCDQPFISANHINNLLHLFERGKCGLIASEYAGTSGTPAIVGRQYFSKLLELSGDRGAKILFLNFSGDLELVPFAAGKFDIDTREDYLNLINEKGEPS